jgi:hypothetical protein
MESVTSLMMFLLAAAALAGSSSATLQSSRPAAVVAEATVTVRIVSGVRLKFDSPTNEGAPPPHDSKVRTEGNVRPARLIEFE